MTDGMTDIHRFLTLWNPSYAADAMDHGESCWYLVAWCPLSEGVRSFRLDRVLGAEPTGEWVRGVVEE